MKNECKVYGMDYLYGLSRGAIGRSDAPAALKTGLAFSLNCFYRLYGGPDEDFPADAEKCGLYELAYRLVTLSSATDELKAMWYVYFPYVILSGAPHDEGLYEELKAALTGEPVFKKVLESRYGQIVFDSADEARDAGVDPLVIDWYEPFIAYKFGTEGGDTRIAAELKRRLALGDFAYAAEYAGRLIELFPSDQTLILVYLAAETGGLPGKPGDERAAAVTDLLAFIEAVKDLAGDIAAELSYYRGLCLIALADIDGARDAFETSLLLKPSYEPAVLMLRGIDKIAGQA